METSRHLKPERAFFKKRASFFSQVTFKWIAPGTPSSSELITKHYVGSALRDLMVDVKVAG